MDSSAQQKIDLIKKAGLEKLHVLSDFDRTLTKPHVRGKDVPSLISIPRDGKYLTPDYASKAHALFDHYHAIEIDTRIPREEKKEKMREWWSKHFELLIASKLTKKDIKDAMQSRGAELRDGAHEFFTLLHKKNIPIIIMSSSGLGLESIKAFLTHEQIIFNNVFIISNQFIWDADEKAVGIKKPIIHCMNKDEAIIKNFPEMYTQIKERKNVILLGDNEGDLDMITGFQYETLLTVGFTLHDDLFDISLHPDNPLTSINQIVKDMIK